MAGGSFGAPRALPGGRPDREARSRAGSLGPLLAVTIASVFLLSPNLLVFLGVGYTSPTSGALEKIHPSIFLLVLCLALRPRPSSVERDREMTRASLAMAAITLLAIAFFALASPEAGGGEISALIVTYLTPALLLLALADLNERSRERVGLTIGTLLVANSALGIVEHLSGWRLLPFVAGDAILGFDRRSTALLGHPLTNALVTGGWVLAQLMRGFTTRLRAITLASIGLHMTAMFSFGGRAALVFMLAAFAGFVLYEITRKLSHGRGGREIAVAAILFYFFLAALPVVFLTGAADPILDRFADSRGSNETRLAALRMLAHVEGWHWLTGTPLSLRSLMQRDLGSVHGIELSWIALVVIFGLPIAAALLAGMLAMLRAAGRHAGMQGLVLGAYFVATSFTALSIASKTMLVSQFLLLLFCLPAYRPASSSITRQ